MSGIVGSAHSLSWQSARPALVLLGISLAANIRDCTVLAPSIRAMCLYYLLACLKLNRCNGWYLFVYLALLSHAQPRRPFRDL